MAKSKANVVDKPQNLNGNSETHVVEVVAEEIPQESPEKILEKVDVEINKSLQKYNFTDNFLSELKEKHKNLSISGQEDKEGYVAVHEARMEFVNTRVRIKALCEVGREQAVLTQKQWIAKQKELISRIEPDEKRLKQMEDEYDAEKDRLKSERLELQRNRLRTRMQELLAMGAVNDGISVYLDEVSFDMAVIREADDEEYLEDILPEYKKLFDKKELVRIEAEDKKKKDDEETQRNKDEFDRQQKAFKQQQEEFENQKKEAAKKIRDRRAGQLSSIGMIPEFPSGDFVFEDSRVQYSILENANDENWDMYFTEVKKGIDGNKEKAEEKRQKEETQRLEDARKKAAAEILKRERVADMYAIGYGSTGILSLNVYKTGEPIPKEIEVLPDFILSATPEEWSGRIKSLSEFATKEDARIEKEKHEQFLKDVAEKERLEGIRKQEEADRASDKQKWDTFIDQLNQVKLPVMKRQPYKEFVENASIFIKKINGIKK
jgi:hypothetical protein